MLVFALLNRTTNFIILPLAFSNHCLNVTITAHMGLERSQTQWTYFLIVFLFLFFVLYFSFQSVSAIGEPEFWLMKTFLLMNL